MSHSQFHSTNLFILRHAWLNLWDKHMTTGRINQVTISTCTKVQHQYSRLATLSTGGCSLQGFNYAFVWISSQSKTMFRPKSYWWHRDQWIETPCIPFSQVLGVTLQVLQGLESHPSVKTTSNRTCLKDTLSHGVSSIDYLLSGLAIGN